MRIATAVVFLCLNSRILEVCSAHLTRLYPVNFKPVQLQIKDYFFFWYAISLRQHNFMAWIEFKRLRIGEVAGSSELTTEPSGSIKF